MLFIEMLFRFSGGAENRRLEWRLAFYCDGIIHSALHLKVFHVKVMRNGLLTDNIDNPNPKIQSTFMKHKT